MDAPGTRPRLARLRILIDVIPRMGRHLRTRRVVTRYTSGQILCEYLVVATRPEAQNGLGMDVRDAVDNVRILRPGLDYLTEEAKAAHRLTELVTATGTSDKQIHAADVVATALVHGVDAVTTLNTADFERSVNCIRVTGLDS